jgi:uncharacterized protein (TIGR02246 family)
LAAALGILSACTSPPGSSADAEAIRRINQQYIELHPEGEVDRLMTLYTDDALLMPPGSPPLEGLEEIRAHWSDFFDDWEVLEATSIIDEVILSEDWAYARGHYSETLRAKDSDARVVDSGSFSGIWRRQRDGSWKIARDMWNANAAPDSGS